VPPPASAEDSPVAAAAGGSRSLDSPPLWEALDGDSVAPLPVASPEDVSLEEPALSEELAGPLAEEAVSVSD
jgi:hypothetical protein